MPSFSTCQRLNGARTVGENHTHEAMNIVEDSWYNDPASTVAYMYDYYHDDQRDTDKNLNPEASKTKIPVDIKYFINAYQSLAKDTVDYRIMFKPSYECNIPYYDKMFTDVVDSDFPVGLYIDIKDEKGIWKRWLVVATANEHNRDFPNYSILPCNYKYQWVFKGKKYQMWGCPRSQNSYNSGVWEDYRTESIENQTKFMLPYNDISKTLFYNQRMIVSAPLPQPICWRISKVEPLNSRGIINYTLVQDLYDEHHDYIEKDEDGKIIGMYADYYKDSILPYEPPYDPEAEKWEDEGNYGIITCSGVKPQIKINGSYRTITVEYYNSGELLKDQTPGEWSFFIDDNDVSDLIKILPTDNVNQIKIKFLGDENFIDKALTIVNSKDRIVAKLRLDIVAL